MSGGDGNMSGVLGAREERKSRYLMVKGERREGDTFLCHYGMDTGNDWVGG